MREQRAAHKGHLHIPAGMAVMGGEEAVHTPTGVTYVTGA